MLQLRTRFDSTLWRYSQKTKRCLPIFKKIAKLIFEQRFQKISLRKSKVPIRALFYFKGLCMLLCIEYNFVQMSATALMVVRIRLVQFPMTLPYRSGWIRAMALVRLTLRVSVDCNKFGILFHTLRSPVSYQTSLFMVINFELLGLLDLVSKFIQVEVCGRSSSYARQGINSLRFPCTLL